MPIGITGVPRIGLPEMQRHAALLRPSVRERHERCGQVDAMHLGIRKRFLKRDRLGARPATEIENAARREIRIALAHHLRDVAADTGLADRRVSRQPFGGTIQLDRAEIDQSGLQIFGVPTREIATRLTMNFDAIDRRRRLQSRIELQ